MTATSHASHAPTPKTCPRCGAFYQDLSSQTCPQCFARLEPLTDDEAQELIEAQEKRAQDPAFLKAKNEEDEKFREQSFGACFGVAVIVLVVVMVSVTLLVMALHQHRKTSVAGAVAQPGAIGSNSQRTSMALPPDIDTFLPPKIGQISRISEDADLVLPGTLTRIYHGVYQSGVQVYAVNVSGLSDEQLNAFHLAVSFVAEQHNPPLVQQDVLTVKAHYIVIGVKPADTSTVAAILHQ